ncbi:MAG: hypothetical protein AMXMBFR37_18170 [Steroidobacteraceae bacterium]|nr:hypothetical protein [Steroidobacteraceae bacterium]
MRVVTPAMKLDVRIDTLAARDGLLVMSGVAGMLPCETTLRPTELRTMIGKLMRPSVLKLLLSRDPPR